MAETTGALLREELALKLHEWACNGFPVTGGEAILIEGVLFEKELICNVSTRTFWERVTRTQISDGAIISETNTDTGIPCVTAVKELRCIPHVMCADAGDVVTTASLLAYANSLGATAGILGGAAEGINHVGFGIQDGSKGSATFILNGAAEKTLNPGDYFSFGDGQAQHGFGNLSLTVTEGEVVFTLGAYRCINN